MRGRRIFLTGGTGFFGCWLLESFAWANDRLQLGASATVLTRDPEVFRAKVPHLASHPAVRLHQGDVRSYEFPGGDYSHIIHAAGSPSAVLREEDPRLVTETLIEGTRRTLAFARRCRAGAMLLVSSGAVDGQRSAYAEGKQAAERLCEEAARTGGLRVPIARCFAFLGPYQPLDGQWAAGNFIRDALQGGPIQVTGDGTPWRSYLYAADLAIWLWTLLFRGRSGQAYNVGSEQAVTITQLARLVASACAPDVEVRIARPPVLGAAAERYVPSTLLPRRELGLEQTVTLEEAVRRTLAWHQAGRTLVHA